MAGPDPVGTGVDGGSKPRDGATGGATEVLTGVLLFEPEGLAGDTARGGGTGEGGGSGIASGTGASFLNSLGLLMRVAAVAALVLGDGELN